MLLGGVVGNDAQAGLLRDVLGRSGVDASGLVVDQNRPTTTKSRIMAHHQQVVRVDSEDRSPLPPAVENDLLAWSEHHLPRVDACIVSDYAKGVISPRLAETVLRSARQAGKPVVVDPKGTDYRKYRGATVLKPNIHEAEQVVGLAIHDEADLEEAGHILLDLVEGSALLITRGPQGMSLLRPGEQPLHIPAVTQEVFDVTGAGDTVVSTLALALAAGASLEQAAYLANQAAGIVVRSLGTSTVPWNDLAACVS